MQHPNPPSDSSSSVRPHPSTIQRKVSLPPPASSGHPLRPTQAHRKILARKPTPFNSELAEAIKNSGLSAAITEPDDELASFQATNTPSTKIDDDALSKAKSTGTTFTPPDGKIGAFHVTATKTDADTQSKNNPSLDADIKPNGLSMTIDQTVSDGAQASNVDPSNPSP